MTAHHVTGEPQGSIRKKLFVGQAGDRAPGARRIPFEIRPLPSHSRRVTKAALGRGLGELLKKPGVAPKENRVHISLGLSTLLRTETPVASPPASPVPDLRRVRWSLFAADALLCGLIVVMMAKSRSPLSAVETVLCLAGVGLGAWLACLAFTLGTKPERD